MVFLIPLGPFYLKKIQTNCILNPDFQPIGSLPEVYRLQNTSSGFCCPLLLHVLGRPSENLSTKEVQLKSIACMEKTLKFSHTRGKQSCLCKCSANNRSGRNVQIT